MGSPRVGDRPGREHLRVALPGLLLCTLPYLGLRAYLSFGMHGAEAVVEQPAAWMLAALFGLGVIVPTAGVAWTLRSVLRDRLHFRLSGLLEAYAVLVALFASGYAIVQASHMEGSFTGMPPMWPTGGPLTLEAHVARLHELFFESLYLSVMTITTVGFGDVVPLTRVGKALTAVEGLAGIGFVGVALGHYFSVCLGPRRSGLQARAGATGEREVIEGA